MRRSSSLLFASLGLALAGDAWAAPITVNVGSTTYATTVRNRLSGEFTQTSINPLVGVTLYENNPQPYWPQPYLAASADARLFDVAITAVAPFNPLAAFASARSVAEFSPTANGTASLGITFDGWQTYAIEVVALFDVTANHTMWQYANCVFACANAGLSADTIMIDPSVRSLMVDQALDASHLYRLSIYTAANAAGDSQAMRTSVSGLTAMPEPSTVLLLGTALLVCFSLRRSATQIN
jgi:hypothetical protein